MTDMIISIVITINSFHHTTRHQNQRSSLEIPITHIAQKAHRSRKAHIAQKAHGTHVAQKAHGTHVAQKAHRTCMAHMAQKAHTGRFF